MRVALRRLTDSYRSDDARRRRETLAASWSSTPARLEPERDDTVTLMLMCCHPALSPGAAIPLTLRAVGGLTTAEIAAAFLLPEATVAQRISRAKAKIKEAGARFTLPTGDERTERLRSVLHVLYLMFNEGYASAVGRDLERAELAREAIRLARELHDALPADPEATGLLALMLLTDARRPARTDASGALIPLAEQDRRLWDRGQIAEGVALVTSALREDRRMGEYLAQAAIAAVHDQAPSPAQTHWDQILALYDVLARMTANPVVLLNRAAAVGMARGAAAGLEALDGLDEALGDHHRLHAVRAHLLERVGDRAGAAAAFRRAAGAATNERERDYLRLQAARLR